MRIDGMIEKILRREKPDPDIKIVPDYILRGNPRPPFNKLCDISDWRNGRFVDYVQRIKGPHTHIIHRKPWEYVNCVWGLEELGAVREDSTALSVGAGHEPPLYYFANAISKMVATDIYQGSGIPGNPEMLTNPAKFAPFPYRESHLEVVRMNGLELGFPADTFDFAFSLSSIEHFGGHEGAAKTLREIYRVLKPGGVCCITTELILNNQPNGEFFTSHELREYVLQAAPFELVGPDIDWRISESILKYPIDMRKERAYLNDVSPHIVLQRGNTRFTSIILFLHK